APAPPTPRPAGNPRRVPPAAAPAPRQPRQRPAARRARLAEGIPQRRRPAAEPRSVRAPRPPPRSRSRTGSWHVLPRVVGVSVTPVAHERLELLVDLCGHDDLQ